jgi:hypothetical protein
MKVNETNAYHGLRGFHGFLSNPRAPWFWRFVSLLAFRLPLGAEKRDALPGVFTP